MGEEARAVAAPSDGYSLAIGMVYCFNLMMGAGLLALPKAFVQAGWLMGLGGVAVLAFMSYCTVTFIIEAQSIHNALNRCTSNGTNGTVSEEVEMNYVIENKNVANGHHADKNSGDALEEENNNPNNSKVAPVITDDENNSQPYMYDITLKAELGELCNVFLNKFGYLVFYVAFCMYLFGSTSVYAAAISKSLASIVCSDQESFHVGNDTVPCNNIPSLTLMQTYRISLAVFVVLCCPWTFFTLSKTKILQLSTMAFRCFALTSMIVLALIKIVKGEGAKKTPKLGDITKLPDYVSISIYAFMCQYCIPGLITPIRNKRKITLGTLVAFFFVVLFSSSILMTATYGFDADEVQDLYTLSFEHPVAFRYILELFPVLTLGTSFPIISIALRDNVKKLFLTKPEEEYGLFLRRILFPVVAVLPSIVISYCTYEVGILVSYTGAYAGGIIQYVIPVFLVYCARKKAVATFGVYDNMYASPMAANIWLLLVLLWYVASLCFVTYSKVKHALGK